MATRIDNHGEFSDRVLALLALRVPLSAGHVAKALWVARDTASRTLVRLERSHKARIWGFDPRTGKGLRAVLYTIA